MQLETLKAIEVLIEKFGFPILLSLGPDRRSCRSPIGFENIEGLKILWPVSVGFER
jgi:hypothetical protein